MVQYNIRRKGKMRSYFRLDVPAGAPEEEADSLLALFCEVLKHRLWHWRRGDGWVD